MASYKVIQDIEAEDKLLGPLTLRQFLFALGASFGYYISFILASNHAGFLLVLLIPPTLFATFFALPIGKDQPTEVWALAKIRFFIKPRVRIWNQSGVKELVTITVPKKIERVLTNGLSQNEVQSRLKALANTIDSRGWAIKNVNVNLYSQQSGGMVSTSDRLLGMSAFPQEVPTFDIQASDDMLDEQSNPIAQQFDTMMNASSQAHRQQLIDKMNSPAPIQVTQPVAAPVAMASTPVDYWFLNQPTVPANLPADQAMFKTAPVVQPGASGPAPLPDQRISSDEAALTAQLKAHHSGPEISYSHLRTIQPLGTQAAVASPVQSVLASQPAAQSSTLTDSAAPVTPAASPVTPVPDAAILSLANNNDLNVATLARQAQKAKENGLQADGEVVISLR